VSSAEQPVLFVESKADVELAKALYRTPALVRVALFQARELAPLLGDTPLWIDPGFDSFPRPSADTPWSTFFRQTPAWKALTDGEFVRKPAAAAVRELLLPVLEQAMALSPAWLSIPQVRIGEGSEHNRLNRVLAEETGRVLREGGFRGKAILPIILSLERQSATRAARARAAVAANLGAAGADGIWLVDAGLDDEAGTPGTERRFKGLVEMHDEIDSLDPSVMVAGPYWAFGLVVWARGLATHVATAPGSGYHYHSPGLAARRDPMARLAVRSLRKRVRAGDELREWLDRCLKDLDAADDRRPELEELKKKFAQLVHDGGRRQVASVWRDWFVEVADLSPPSRPLALYQEFSRAFLLGKSLPPVPTETGSAKKPYQPAQQLMLHCV
jgi:hypothetical protein